MRPNEFCIIPPNLEITLEWATAAELLILYIDMTGFAGRDLLPHDFVSKGLRPLAQRDRCLVQLAKVYLAACHEVDRPESYFFEGAGIALASRAVAQYSLPSKTGPKARSGLSIEMIDEVTKHIDAHLGDAILAKDLARRVGLSPDHFARRFKITTHMGPKHFTIKRQMENVHALLSTGKFNVTEAGRKSGFNDLSHLNRCFRKVFGCSPKAVLKKALASDLSQ